MIAENHMLTIVMYHYVRNLKDSRYPEIKGLELNDFKKQIDFLLEHYNIISTQTLIESIKSDTDLPERAALLTFDDGYIDHYTNVFPILMDKGISGFFSMPGKILKERKVLDVNKLHYILASEKPNNILIELFNLLNFYRGSEFDFESNELLFKRLAIASRFDTKEVIFIKRILQTALPEKLRNVITDELFKRYVSVSEKALCEELYMNLDQIKLMKNSGMSFGIHGYDHYWLADLSHDDMVNDIKKALDVFDGIIDPNEWIMCYPYGSANEDVRNFIKSNGCVFGLGVDINIAELYEDKLFCLPRFDTNDFPPRGTTYKNFKE